MRVGLFIPCFMDQLFPEASMASFKLLRKLGVDVIYPMEQTCCGQPMANSGCGSDVEHLAKKFVRTFKEFDYVVAPSGSCVTMVKEQYAEHVSAEEGYEHLRTHIYELCEFLHDVLKIESLDASFPFKVGVHNSCHAHRGLELAAASELNVPYYSKLKNLLSLVDGISLVELKREDECCGFGGTFAVAEPDVSVFMGRDRISDHEQAGAEYITGVDNSCLMHMNGLIQREKRNIKVIHIAQILLGERV